MAKRYSITVIDEDGAAQAALDVDLYVGDGNATAKTGDFTDNTDGTYYIDVAATGEYTVKIGGVIQTELQSIWISVDDSLTTGDIINTLVSTSTVDALSAAQGKVLQDAKVAIASIVNDLTTGGVAVPLSAEQGKTLQTNKIETTVVGDRLYTDENVVTDSQSLTASIDALDQALGDFNWAGTTLIDLNPTDLVSAIKNLAYQIARNFQMIAGTTELQFTQEIIGDQEIAAAAADIADTSLEHTATGAIYQDKYRVTFYKGSSDKYLRLKCLLKTNNASYKAWAYLKITGVEEVKISSINTGWDIVNLAIDISAYGNSSYTMAVGVSNENASGVSTMKSVVVTKSSI